MDESIKEHQVPMTREQAVLLVVGCGQLLGRLIQSDDQVGVAAHDEIETMLRDSIEIVKTRPGFPRDEDATRELLVVIRRLAQLMKETDHE